MQNSTVSRKRPFQMRFPDDLRAHIERRLAKSKRDLTKETLWLIERGLEAVDDPMPQGEE